MNFEPNAQLALNAILRKSISGIPSWLLNIMEHRMLDHFAGKPEGSYKKDPENTYLLAQKNINTCMIDQYIPDNPLTMGDHGYEGTEHGATTGAEQVYADGMLIDSPEAVVKHLEEVEFPRIQKRMETFDAVSEKQCIIEREQKKQNTFGPSILSVPYGVIHFPTFGIGTYGYVYYLMAYALYPEIMEKHFKMQADFYLLKNQVFVEAFKEEKYPPLVRLDYDMADSRGVMVDPKSLDKLWFPHFARCIDPAIRAGIQLIWHCDGNLMDMVPRLLDVGLSGFQGFQYEDGMDYEAIAQMKTKNNDTLFIVGGVSVTKTLPYGTPEDVKEELRWLVEHSPDTGFFLGASSSITPGTPKVNLETFVEGLNYYRKYGKSGL